MTGQTQRWLIVGRSGSGKSRLIADEILPAFEGRYRYLVVVNDSSELSDGCSPVYIDDERAGDSYDFARMIRDAGRLHVELLAVDPRSILDQLAAAILEVGDVLLVLDEAHEWIPANRPPRGMVRLYKQGRKRGVHIVAATQSLLRTSTSGLDPDAIRQSTALVLFQQSETNEVERVREVFPELGERVAELAPPGDGGEPPEYAVLDARSRRGLIHGRQGSSWLTDRAGQGAADQPRRHRGAQA